jgi:hypothetical protein
LEDGYVQSIIGATEKRRESGAGVAVVTDMGDLESVRLGGGGVYQEWADGARACLRAIGQVLGIALKTSRKSRKFPSSRVPIAHIALPLITQLTSLRRCKFSDKGVEALHRI